MRRRKETEYIRSLIRRDSPVQPSVEYVPGEPGCTLTKCPMCGCPHKIAYDGREEIGYIPKFCEECGQRLKND